MIAILRDIKVPKEYLLSLIEIIDDNKDGYISIKEVLTAIKKAITVFKR